ncbi:MAG: hypothetical protein ACJAX8_002144, partial [Flavobacteriales bacterium]
MKPQDFSLKALERGLFLCSINTHTEALQLCLFASINQSIN